MRSAGEQRPVVVGLTGNIGTGKSTVAAMLADLGAEVVDADKVAHEVMRPGTRIHTQIVEVFGRGVLTPRGEIDRKQLGAIVFSDSRALTRLEAIVHPGTLEAIERWIGASSADVVVVEAIKLIESSLASECDAVWVTTCPPAQQIARIVSARDLTRAEARQRVEAQPPQEEKVARADVVVDNGGSLEATRAQVEAAWRRTIERRVGSAKLGNEPC